MKISASFGQRGLKHRICVDPFDTTSPSKKCLVNLYVLTQNWSKSQQEQIQTWWLKQNYFIMFFQLF